MWTALIILAVVVALAFFFGKPMIKLVLGDTGTDDAANRCAELAWKLEHSCSGPGDPEAFTKFDEFWALVEKHSFDNENVDVASFKTVLNHACLAFEKYFAGDVLQRHQSERYRREMSGRIEDYLETLGATVQTA